MYEAMKASITETSLVKLGVITIQQNLIHLPTYELYEMPPLEVLYVYIATFHTPNL
jgi:hypothetical protein